MKKLDVAGMKELYASLDFVGISAYPRYHGKLAEMEDSTQMFDQELKVGACGCGLRVSGEGRRLPAATHAIQKKLAADRCFEGVDVWCRLAPTGKKQHPHPTPPNGHPPQLFGIDLVKLINAEGKEFVFNEFGIGGGASVSGDAPARTWAQVENGPFFGVYGPYTRKLDPWRLFLPCESAQRKRPRHAAPRPRLGTGPLGLARASDLAPTSHQQCTRASRGCCLFRAAPRRRAAPRPSPQTTCSSAHARPCVTGTPRPRCGWRARAAPRGAWTTCSCGTSTPGTCRWGPGGGGFGVLARPADTRCGVRSRSRAAAAAPQSATQASPLLPPNRTASIAPAVTRPLPQNRPPQAIHMESTTKEGSYLDDTVCGIIRGHNLMTRGLKGYDAPGSLPPY